MFTIVGGNGLIGRNLVQALRQAGQAVLVPKRDDERLYSRPLGKVIYAAGLTADFRTRPFDTVNAHVSLLTGILEKAEFESLLYLSSTRVYSGARAGRESEPISVQTSDSSDLYNISKLMGESICFSCGREGVKIARLSNVVDKADRDGTSFLSILVTEAKAGRIVLQADPHSAKDYVSMDDVIDTLLWIAASAKQPIYNVASGVQLSHGELADRLKSLTGCAVEVMPQAPKICFPPVSIERLHSECGYTPRSITAIIDEMVGNKRQSSCGRDALRETRTG